MTALSTINLLPSNREEIRSFVGTLKSEILANERDPLKILVQLKMIEKTIEDLLKDEELDRHFLKEFLLYDKEKVVMVRGAKLQAMEVGTKYDYTKSGDPIWNDLEKKAKDIADKKKEREKFLQNIPYDAGIVEAETGVFITRPPKTSHSKVKVTF